MKDGIGSAIGLVLCVIVLIGLPTGLYLYDLTGPGYQYNNEVHSHMQNAYDANNPELMKEQLLLVVKGMRDLGLTDNMYDAFWAWDKTPEKRMDYQYQHLDGILERIDAVIIWRNATYGNNSQGTETLGDVYEQKMDNLRMFLQEDSWSDWIANGAFYANFHVFLYTAMLWALIIWIVFLIGAILFLFG